MGASRLIHKNRRIGRADDQFNTSREIPAPIEEVFAAIKNQECLGRWWGPAGFTDTSSVCEFKKGGGWSFVMHGPDGRKRPNESVFAEIKFPTKVVSANEQNLDRLTGEVLRKAGGQKIILSAPRVAAIDAPEEKLSGLL